ncbi:hypothetical protein V2J09_014195 [Rumex salicifolius]
MAPIAPSEFKVYDYLVESAACNQTKEIVHEFLEKCQPFNLAKAETLNILNIRPFQPSQIYPIIEKADDRLGLKGLEELVEMVVEVLPAPPYEPKFDEETAEEANTDDETAEMANADEENAIADEEIATEEQTVGS